MAPFSTIVHRTGFLSGLFVTVLGAVCLLAVGDLEVGNALEMGPGYVPRALAWFLLLSGLGMTVVALWRHSPPMPPIVWRPLLLISLSVAVFGALVDGLGIVIAVIVSTIIATLASSISRWRETPVLCAVLAVLAAVAFVQGLGLAIPIWPR
jgi:putative tricarboxylic transport membrane protein